MSNVSNDAKAFDTNHASGRNDSFSCIDWPHCATREIDMAGWLFKSSEDKNSNLTYLPALAMIIFIVLVCMKFYKWYKDDIRRKERGDVEFGDESEVNYGIIKEGDKEFCKVDIRSDTTSVYDTVNSIRILGNGHATCVGATPAYHDTVSSYKSLLMQRGDASHYDSVKSYKAFLKQVTQNKDLDVEVKLLENYPVKCKSTEHCVLVEEECGISPNSNSKLLHGNIRISADGKKKFRYRRASGEPYGPMRKRSASNPIYNYSRPGASSLPSIHYSVSSDSSAEEDTHSAFRTERRKAFEDRCKKMSRSCSGGKLSKDSKTLEEDQEAENPKRRRHFSADGGSKSGRPLMGPGNLPFKISRAFQHELNNLRESISETDPKPEEHVLVVVQDDSSSENPDSSPSSRNSSFSSDAMESESDDETQQVTQISAMSDCTTFNSNNLGSSAEQLSNHSTSASLDGLAGIDLGCGMTEALSSCHQTSSENNFPSKQTGSQQSCKQDISNSRLLSDHPEAEKIPHNFQTTNHEHSLRNGDDEIPPHIDVKNDFSLAPKEVPSIIHPSKQSTSKPAQGKTQSFIDVDDSEDTDNSLASNPRLVKRFHVTSVQGSDLSSVKSDQRGNSSGGSALES